MTNARALIDQDIVARFRNRLVLDLEDRAWDRGFGHLRAQPTYDGSMRLTIRD